MKLNPILGAALLGSTFSVSAQKVDHSSLQEVVVTASPHEKTSDQIAGSINTISGNQLQREAAASLGETLQGQVGVHSSSFGPGVGTPVIRGQSGKRVEVLQNNTVVADVSDTSPDHATATEALLAERIEILRGPATLRYGPGAIGGVVNVITNRIHTSPFEGVEGAVEARYGDNQDEQSVVGRLDAGNGPFALHIDGMTRKSDDVEIPGLANEEVDDIDETTDGFIENTDTEADAFSIGLSWVGDKVAADISVNQLNNEYGIPPGSHGHHEEEGGEGEEEHEDEEVFTRIDMEQTTWQGKLLFKGLGDFFNNLDIDASYTDYEHQELEIDDGATEEGTSFEADSLELRSELTHKQTAGWLGAFGYQYSDRDFTADGAEAFVPPSQTANHGFYWLEETQLGNSSLELGMRYDRQTLEPETGSDIDHNSFNASASLIIPVGENSRFNAILSRSERAPTAEELLSDGEHIATNTYEIGDANLDTESAINLELSWAYQGDIDIRATLYHNQFSDYIYERDTELRFSHDLEESGLSGIAACSDNLADFDNDADEFNDSVECFQFVQEDASFTGAELELEIPVAENHKLKLQGDYVRAKLDDNGDVPRIPATTIGATWNWEVDHWYADIGVTHGFEQDKPGENQESTDSYTRIDAAVTYSRDNWSVFLRGRNLADEEIRNATSFLREIAPEPGRNLTLGVRYRF